MAIRGPHLHKQAVPRGRGAINTLRFGGTLDPLYVAEEGDMVRLSIDKQELAAEILKQRADRRIRLGYTANAVSSHDVEIIIGGVDLDSGVSAEVRNDAVEIECGVRGQIIGVIILRVVGQNSLQVLNARGDLRNGAGSGHLIFRVEIFGTAEISRGAKNR